MADDVTLERFLAAAAPLRGNLDADPLRMFELLDAVRFDGDDALAWPLHDALEFSIAAVRAPEARSAAIARYVFERVAIEIEARLRSSGAPPVDHPSVNCGETTCAGASSRLHSTWKAVMV